MPETQGTLEFPEVGPVGLEPTTNGLKDDWKDSEEQGDLPENPP